MAMSNAHGYGDNVQTEVTDNPQPSFHSLRYGNCVQRLDVGGLVSIRY